MGHGFRGVSFAQNNTNFVVTYAFLYARGSSRNSSTKKGRTEILHGKTVHLYSDRSLKKLRMRSVHAGSNTTIGWGRIVSLSEPQWSQFQRSSLRGREGVRLADWGKVMLNDLYHNLRASRKSILFQSPVERRGCPKSSTNSEKMGGHERAAWCPLRR